MSRRKKKGIDDKIEDLNLVPIMNLVVCLIPMVLVGTALVKLGVIPVNAPNFGTGKAPEAEEDNKPLNLTIGLGKDAIYLKAGGVTLRSIIRDGDPSEDGGIKIPVVKAMEMRDLTIGNVTVSKPYYFYNYPVLYQRLVQIKESIQSTYPKENTIKVSADKEIPVRHVIETMDLMRYHLCLPQCTEWANDENKGRVCKKEKPCDASDRKADFADAAELRRARVYKEKAGEGEVEKPVDLWPVVIFAKVD